LDNILIFNKIKSMKKLKSKKLLSIITILVIGTLLFTGCADVTPIENCVNTEPYGFLNGL